MTMVEIMETSEYKNIDSRVVTDGLKLYAIGLLMIFSFFIFNSLLNGFNYIYKKSNEI